MRNIFRRSGQVKTLRVGEKLIILNGRDPLMYVDLTERKLYKFEESEPTVRFINPKPVQSDEDFIAEIDEVLGDE